MHNYYIVPDTGVFQWSQVLLLFFVSGLARQGLDTVRKSLLPGWVVCLVKKCRSFPWGGFLCKGFICQLCLSWIPGKRLKVKDIDTK
jgi:hypothetical protein